MLVRDVMSTPVITVRSDATLKSVVQVLDEHAITAVPVVDEGHLVGIVSEADLIRGGIPPDQRLHERPVHFGDGWSHRLVADVMTAHPVTVTGSTDLAVAVDLISNAGLKSLPVVDRGAVVGMLTRRDVIRLMSRGDPRIQAEIGELVRAAERDWRVVVDDGVATIEGPATPAEHDLARALVLSVAGVTGVRITPAQQGRVS